SVSTRASTASKLTGCPALPGAKDRLALAHGSHGRAGRGESEASAAAVGTARVGTSKALSGDAGSRLAAPRWLEAPQDRAPPTPLGATRHWSVRRASGVRINESTLARRRPQRSLRQSLRLHERECVPRVFYGFRACPTRLEPGHRGSPQSRGSERAR